MNLPDHEKVVAEVIATPETSAALAALFLAGTTAGEVVIDPVGSEIDRRCGCVTRQE